MHCPECGTQVERADKFCRECAHPLRSVPAPTGDDTGGDKVGKDRITAGDMTDVSNAAIGEGSSVTSDSVGTKIIEAKRLAGKEFSILWGVFKYATFVTVAGSIVLLALVVCVCQAKSDPVDH